GEAEKAIRPKTSVRRQTHLSRSSEVCRRKSTCKRSSSKPQTRCGSPSKTLPAIFGVIDFDEARRLECRRVVSLGQGVAMGDTHGSHQQDDRPSFHKPGLNELLKVTGLDVNFHRACGDL